MEPRITQKPGIVSLSEVSKNYRGGVWLPWPHESTGEGYGSRGPTNPVQKATPWQMKRTHHSIEFAFRNFISWGMISTSVQYSDKNEWIAHYSTVQGEMDCLVSLHTICDANLDLVEGNVVKITWSRVFYNPPPTPRMGTTHGWPGDFGYQLAENNPPPNWNFSWRTLCQSLVCGD